MHFKVCSFNNTLIVLVEAPRHFAFTQPYVNRLTLRQTFNLYPNFIQYIAVDLEKILQTYRVVSILYSLDSTKMNNFPNGSKQTITYYIYYTTLDDCIIDNVFYDELLTHLTKKLGMSYYVAQVFLQALRHGFNKPDKRIDSIVNEFKLKTQHDDLEEIRHLILNLSLEQKIKIETLVAKNSTFNSILPNMLLLNVTNCIQQESLSIKHSDGKDDMEYEHIAVSNGVNGSDIDNNNNDDDDDDYDANEGDCTKMDIDLNKEINDDAKRFKTYIPHTEFHQHNYYCSYGSVVIVEADIQLSVFHNLIIKNLIAAFWVKRMYVDQLHIYMYIDKSKFNLLSKIRICGKILQYKIHQINYNIDLDQVPINYNIDMNVQQLYSTAPLVMANIKMLKDSFKTKLKVIQLYVVVCEQKLHKLMTEWRCICKIIRIITSPFNKNTFYHTQIHIHEHDIDFIYRYLPNIGLDGTPCKCIANDKANTMLLPHSQKLWQMRSCIELLYHTHFDWTILKIHNDLVRRPNANNIFKLYDVYDSGKLRIAHLLETKVFKTAIENLTTFRLYNQTGLLFPFQTSGYEQLYTYTLIKMTRVVYRCIAMPLIKLERLSTKSLLPSKYILTYSFIDDPLTPTISVRGPQSTRNLKSIETSGKMFDTKVINVTMLMNSFNLCGSESNENKIKV